MFLAAGVAGAIFAGGFFAYPPGFAKPVILFIEAFMVLSIAVTLPMLVAGPPRREARAMTSATLAGLIGAALVGLGLYGLIANPQPLRKILAFNLMGSGVFLVFGIVARKGAAAGLQADPVPQAMVITGIVVAFAASALAVALVLRLFDETGRAALSPDAWTKPSGERSRRRMTAPPPPLRRRRAGACCRWRSSCPLLGVLLSLVVGGRMAERIALVLMPVQLAIAIAIAVSRVALGAAARLYARRLCAPARHRAQSRRIFCRHAGDGGADRAGRGALRPGQFRNAAGNRKRARRSRSGPCCRAIQAALSLSFSAGICSISMSGLELLTFAAVPLVCLDGRPETVAAALRYSLFALFGSVFYLLGVALLYGAYGTLDIALLASRIRAEPAVWLAAGLMTAGLLAKTALFPLHLWLPPAHANAPAAASAVLSGLVVKGSFFLVVRLWFDVLAALPGVVPGTILAALGSAAILFGSVLALRQERLKLLIAYSTLAQIGYLFLMFPLGLGPWAADAFSGGMMQALSHAFAKAAMFLSAGLIAELLGHDRIAGLGGAGARDAGDVPRARTRRTVADGAAAKRGLRRKMAA